MKNTNYKPSNYQDFECSNSYIDTKDNKHHFKDSNGNDRIDSATTITMSMLSHPAFQDLTTEQRFLYVITKSQYKGAVDRPCNSKNKRLASKFGGKDANKYIYINHKLLTDVFKVYSPKSLRTIENDIDALISHGFIEIAEKKIGQRTIYKFSAAWNDWNPCIEYKNVSADKDVFKYVWVDKF